MFLRHSQFIIYISRPCYGLWVIRVILYHRNRTSDRFLDHICNNWLIRFYFIRLCLIKIMKCNNIGKRPKFREVLWNMVDYNDDKSLDRKNVYSFSLVPNTEQTQICRSFTRVWRCKGDVRPDVDVSPLRRRSQERLCHRQTQFWPIETVNSTKTIIGFSNTWVIPCILVKVYLVRMGFNIR